MVLQYVAASFHLPSVSTANINTVQYRKPHKQYEIPSIPAVVISTVLLPKSNILATFVLGHSRLFSDVSPVLPTYSNHSVTQFTVRSLRLLSGDQLRTPTQTVQLTTHNSKFQSLILPSKWRYQMQLFSKLMLYCTELSSLSRFRHVSYFEMIY
jgi:hypothetical protein